MWPRCFQQYFTNILSSNILLPPYLLSSGNIKQIKYQMLVVVHKEMCGHDVSSNILQIYDPAIFYKYMIQQYFIVTTSTLSSRNIKQIKYQMLVVVHKETWGHDVSSNILQIYNPAIFYCHLTYCLLAILNI